MIEAVSCGGVVIHRGKILLLYKNYRNRYEGWVLPKGTVEEGEEFKDTALREVLEESGVLAELIQYIGKSEYTFNVPDDIDTIEDFLTDTFGKNTHLKRVYGNDGGYNITVEAN